MTTPFELTPKAQWYFRQRFPPYLHDELFLTGILRRADAIRQVDGRALISENDVAAVAAQLDSEGDR